MSSMKSAEVTYSHERPAYWEMIDLDRITHPLRLATGSHQPGSGKGCAMNVISYINGDTEITDYPKCSARPLASLVQMCNDQLAGPDGLLSPENSVLVLDLGWATVGTAGVSDAVYALWIALWIAEMLDNPVWGVVQFATGDGIDAVRRIAALHRDAAAGVIPFSWDKGSASWSAWSAATSAATSASTSAANRAATSAATSAWSAATSAAWSAATSAWSAATSAAWSAAESAAKSASWSAWSAATSASTSAANRAATSAATSAWSAATSAAWSAAESAKSAAAIQFTRNAIQSWRQIAGLDTPNDISVDAVNNALDRIGIC